MACVEQNRNLQPIIKDDWTVNASVTAVADEKRAVTLLELKPSQTKESCGVDHNVKREDHVDHEDGAALANPPHVESLQTKTTTLSPDSGKCVTDLGSDDGRDVAGPVTESGSPKVMHAVGSVSESGVTESFTDLGYDPRKDVTDSATDSGSDIETEVRVSSSTDQPSTGVSGSTDQHSAGVSGSTDQPSAGVSGSTDETSAGVSGSTDQPSAGVSGSTDQPSAGVSGSTDEASAGVSGSTDQASAGVSGSADQPSAGVSGSTDQLPAGVSGSADETSAGVSGSTDQPSAGVSGSTDQPSAGVSGSADETSATVDGSDKSPGSEPPRPAVVGNSRRRSSRAAHKVERFGKQATSEEIAGLETTKVTSKPATAALPPYTYRFNLDEDDEDEMEGEATPCKQGLSRATRHPTPFTSYRSPVPTNTVTTGPGRGRKAGGPSPKNRTHAAQKSNASEKHVENSKGKSRKRGDISSRENVSPRGRRSASSEGVVNGTAQGLKSRTQERSGSVNGGSKKRSSPRSQGPRKSQDSKSTRTSVRLTEKQNLSGTEEAAIEADREQGNLDDTLPFGDDDVTETEENDRSPAQQGTPVDEAQEVVQVSGDTEPSAGSDANGCVQRAAQAVPAGAAAAGDAFRTVRSLLLEVLYAALTARESLEPGPQQLVLAVPSVEQSSAVDQSNPRLTSAVNQPSVSVIQASPGSGSGAILRPADATTEGSQRTSVTGVAAPKSFCASVSKPPARRPRRASQRRSSGSSQFPVLTQKLAAPVLSSSTPHSSDDQHRLPPGQTTGVVSAEGGSNANVQRPRRSLRTSPASPSAAAPAAVKEDTVDAKTSLPPVEGQIVSKKISAVDAKLQRSRRSLRTSPSATDPDTVKDVANAATSFPPVAGPAESAQSGGDAKTGRFRCSSRKLTSTVPSINVKQSPAAKDKADPVSTAVAAEQQVEVPDGHARKGRRSLPEAPAREEQVRQPRRSSLRVQPSSGQSESSPPIQPPTKRRSGEKAHPKDVAPKPAAKVSKADSTPGKKKRRSSLKPPRAPKSPPAQAGHARVEEPMSVQEAAAEEEEILLPLLAANMVPAADCRFQAGDVVWAKVAGHPFWPALVATVDIDEPFYKDNGRSRQLNILYFGDGTERSWISQLGMTQFAGREAFEQWRGEMRGACKTARERERYRAVTGPRRERWEAAVDEAERFLQFPREDRLLLMLRRLRPAEELAACSREVTPVLSPAGLEELCREQEREQVEAQLLEQRRLERKRKRESTGPRKRMRGEDQDTAGDGSPGDGSPGEGSPGDGSPGDGSPGDGSPGDGSPGDGSPGDGSPGDGSPGDGSPGDGSPGEGRPGDGSPGDGSPGEESLDREQAGTTGEQIEPEVRELADSAERNEPNWRENWCVQVDGVYTEEELGHVVDTIATVAGHGHIAISEKSVKHTLTSARPSSAAAEADDGWRENWQAPVDGVYTEEELRHVTETVEAVASGAGKVFEHAQLQHTKS